MSTKFDHAVSLNISITTTNEIPTSREILLAFRKVIKELDENSIMDHAEVFDTMEVINDF